MCGVIPVGTRGLEHATPEIPWGTSKVNTVTGLVIHFPPFVEYFPSAVTCVTAAVEHVTSVVESSITSCFQGKWLKTLNIIFFI